MRKPRPRASRFVADVTAFAIAFGALMRGLAIAFGVGGGGVARRILKHQFPERERSSADEMSHL